MVPYVGILEPFAATNDEGTDKGFPEAALTGKTETSAPLSTKKSFPDRRSRKQSARGCDEEEEEEETRRTAG